MSSMNSTKFLYRRAIYRALRSQRGGRTAQYAYLLSKSIWHQEEDEEEKEEDIRSQPSESFLQFVTSLQGFEDENDSSLKDSSAQERLAAFISITTEWLVADGPNMCCDPLALAVGIASEITELNPDATQEAGGDALLPLLVIAGDGFGTGTDGIRASLNFLSSGVPGLIKARVALASMLRTHLQKCPIDLSFLFPEVTTPQNSDHHESSSISHNNPQQHQQKSGGTTYETKFLTTAVSPTGIELPRHFNWEGYRGYTVLLYLEFSKACLSLEICLFKLRVAGGEGIEVYLVNGVELDITSYPRGGAPHRISASFPSIQMGSGTWHLLSISHSLPYLKRSQIRIAMDDVVILEDDLPYPTGGVSGGSGIGDDKKGRRRVFPSGGSGQLLRTCSDWAPGMPRGVVCEGMVGKLGYAAMFEGELSLIALRHCVSYGPGYLAGTPVPVSHPLFDYDTEMLRGTAYNECLEAIILWAYVPSIYTQSRNFVPNMVQVGTPTKQNWADISSSPGLMRCRGGKRGTGRLAGGVRVDSDYAPLSICTSSRPGGIYDSWFRAGGVKAVLFVMGCIVDTSKNMTSEWDLDVSAFLASLLGILVVLLKASPLHREEALRYNVFHIICVIFHRLPRLTSLLNGSLVSACLDFLELDVDSARNYHATVSPPLRNGPFSKHTTTNQLGPLTMDFILIGAALQGLLLERSLWLTAPPFFHMSLLKRLKDRVDSIQIVGTLSRYIGVYHVLNMMRFIVDRYDEPKSKQSPSSSPCGMTGGAYSATQKMFGGHEDNDIQILKPGTISAPAAQTTTSSKECGSNRDDMKTMLDLCHCIAYAVIVFDISGFIRPHPSGGGNGSAIRKRTVSDTGGGFFLASSVGGIGSSSINIVISVLHEAQNESLLLTLLRLLLRLRQKHRHELRKSLLQGGYLHITAPVLLGSGGYSRRVRIECLTLTVWLLSNMCNGEEELWPYGLDPLANSNSPQQASSALNSTSNLSLPTIQSSRNLHTNNFSEDEIEPLHVSLARCIATAVSRGLWDGDDDDDDVGERIYSSTVMESILPGGSGSLTVSETASTSQCSAGNDPPPPSSTTHEPQYSNHSKRNVWLLLPFAASVMSICSPKAREQAALYVNMAVKSDVAISKMVLLHSGPIWIACLVEIAISDKLSSLSNTMTTTINCSMTDPPCDGAVPNPVETETETENEVFLMQAKRNRSKSISFSPDSTVCEELAVNAIGCMLSDAILLKHTGSDWKLWHRLLSSLDFAATQQLGGGEIGQCWLESTLSCIIVVALNRMTRHGIWSSASLDGVAHVVALADERLVSVQTQPYLINCLVETSRALRGALDESFPNLQQYGNDHESRVQYDVEEDQASLRLRTQAVLHILLRVLVRSLRVAAPVTYTNLSEAERVKLSASSANESMEALNCLIGCSELPIPAAVQTVLYVFFGFRHVIQGTDLSSSEVQSHLSACIMDSVYHYSIASANQQQHHGRTHHPRHDYFSPSATAVRRLLSSAAHCDSIDGIFETLGPEMDAFSEEAARDMYDFVPRFSTDFSTNVLPSPPQVLEPEPSSIENSPSSSIAAAIKDGSLASSSICHNARRMSVPSQCSQGHVWSCTKSCLDQYLLLHAQRVDDEKLRIMRSSAVAEKETRCCQKAWVRLSRSAEAELQLGRQALSSVVLSAAGDCHGNECKNIVQHPLTGLYRNCQWKLQSGLHAGKPPGRICVVLKPVVGGKKRVITTALQPNVVSVNTDSPAMVTEKLGKQLALRSEYVVAITKTKLPSDEIIEDIVGGDSVSGEVGEISDIEHLETQQQLQVSSHLTRKESMGSVGSNEPRGLTVTVSNDADKEEDEEEEKEGIFENEMNSDKDVTTFWFGRVPLGPSGSPFNLSNLMSVDHLVERKGEAVTLITPKGNILGRLLIEDNYIYFVPSDLSRGGGGGGGGAQGQHDGAQNHHKQASGVTGDLADSGTIIRWSLKDVEAVYTRRYRLVDSALELFIMTGVLNNSMFVDFGVTSYDVERRDEFVRVLGKLCNKDTVKHWRIETRHLMQAWQERQISNLDYLLGLNTLAGRSFNDLCQYPVLPWVLNCYGDDKDAYDLQNPNCFRDLSKPMGALNDKRLKEFINRYESFQDPDIPPFMYGSHYSTAVGVILHYLVRLEPFASLHQELHNGSFDVPDRLFSSIPHAWKICTSTLSDVKELTPEWYTLPDFLRNINGYEFGKTHGGEAVCDVDLPKWASTPQDFIHKHRAALESEYVTRNLHKWIDLVFGYKQQGPEAVNSYNVFYYLTYYGAIDLTQIEDEGLRHATELQIAHFGQCPMQLFHHPHPSICQLSRITHPLSVSLKSIDTWIEEESRALKSSNKMVLPLSRAEVGVRCMKILPDGRILAVNGLGVVELFACRWKNPAGTSSYHEGNGDSTGMNNSPSISDQNAPATVNRTSLSNNPEHLNSQQQKTSLVTDNYESDTAAMQQKDNNNSSESRGADAAGSTTGSVEEPQQQSTSFLEVERILPSFDTLPRIPLPTGCDYYSSHSPCTSALLHSAPVVFSSEGRLLYSGGHPSGAVLVWKLDTATGAIVAEASFNGHSAPVSCLSLGGMESGRDLLLSGSCDCTAMVWELRRLASIFNPPQVSRTPYCVIRGHSHPILACCIDVYLGLCLTVSYNTALLHHIASDQLLRVLQPASSSFPRTTTGLRGEEENDFFEVNNTDTIKNDDVLNVDIQSVFNYSAAALSSDGYAVLAFQEELSGVKPGLVPCHHPYDNSNSSSSSSCCYTTTTTVNSISLIELFTINGQSAGRVTIDEGCCCHHLRTVNTLSVIRRLLVVGGDNLLLQVRSVGDLSLVWEMKSSNVVTIGRGGLPTPTATSTAFLATAAAAGPKYSSVVCTEFGPSPETPILLCVGLKDGCMLVQAIPGAEPYLSKPMLSTVGNIISLPARVVKGSVQQAQSLAVSGWRRVSKVYRAGERIVKHEVVEEAQSIVQGVQSKGLMKGIVGYLRPENSPPEGGSPKVDSKQPITTNSYY